ncbi:ecdysteroid 22-kinase family protein [Shewanella sp. KX20019]|uniref:ecdysteroid 22-kinase family protein n=1 Tax=Shewanella sp. KX20019 TaxID=2803864 RepID=UPI001F40A8B3|nr:ecdysteroid 22-kinase family protein [Shewanella sp. KX20019]
MKNNQHEFNQVLSDIVKTTRYVKTEVIQSLWSGYGEIARFETNVPQYLSSQSNRKDKTFVVKHINPPAIQQHPRGWSGDISHQRKLTSYDVEAEFYQHWANNIKPFCALPLFIGQASLSHSCLSSKMIVMSDLDSEGFPVRFTTISAENSKVCLRWLARFHALNMQHQPADNWPQNLWPLGTYWHLATRKKEFNAMEEGVLKNAAVKLDKSLNSCRYKTLVHGDAKIANFCFSDDFSQVAAVDFQYVGGGCGVKDLVYFLGSCLDEITLELNFSQLVDFYFTELHTALKSFKSSCDSQEIEKEWRPLVNIAWADFERFLAGWAPTHAKRTCFTHKITVAAIATL